MNAVVKAEPKLMLLDYMADKYSLKPDEFSKTVKATCGLSTATPEQVAAFLIVAKEYDLNPLTKEIYAFPSKGGGVVPIVSIDGWVNLVNSNPQCDGFEFEMEHSPDGKLIACTCTMHRKDRSHPVSVTEYLSECKRATDPWKMEHRMLRHKAMIQAARYAFGFAGIYDEDEGRTIAESDSVTVIGPRDSAPPRNIKTIEHQPSEGRVVDHEGTASEENPVIVNNVAVPEPHDLVPVQGDTFQAWAERYIGMIKTSPDTATVYKWIDLNQARLKKLEGSAEWTAKVKKETVALIETLRGQPDPITSGPQGEAQTDMGMAEPPKGGKPARGRPKASKAPDMAKDYDAWLTWQLKQILGAETPERIDDIFEALDGVWDQIMPPDKENLMGARREAERRLEQ
jgi:phage recombination protein Bet